LTVPVKQNKNIAFAHKIHLKLRLTINKIRRTLKDTKENNTSITNY